jgi:hypothetical protein
MRLKLQKKREEKEKINDHYTSDRFERVFVYFFVDGKNVSVELARLGLGKVTIYEDRRKLKYQVSC